MSYYRLLSLLPLLLLFACDPNGTTGEETDSDFDREKMLAHWADNVIVPAFSDYANATAALHEAALAYATDPSIDAMANVKAEFENTYLAWQQVSPFMVGPGQELRLQEQSNIYPTDTARLIGQTGVNLELPANSAIQGLPALDYLLFGSRAPSQYVTSITQRTSRLADLAAEAHDIWISDYRDSYVSASGSSANASVDRTVNDFIFWYEKYLRAGKVGIPAGVFSNDPMPMLAEAPYHGDLSKALFLEGLDAAEDFFTTEPGLKEYLDALGVEREGQLLSERIEANFNDARILAQSLDEDFATQVVTDNTAMLRLYDALQRNVILLKVDMLQALNINVDYVDADGD